VLRSLRVQVFVVGHDWGAIVSWNLCLLRPDRVRALVNLSVAFMPRRPGVKPLEYFRAAYGDEYYVCRFQVSNRSSYRPFLWMCHCNLIFSNRWTEAEERLIL
jgi:pimeloyl-ACP methyl ester carboxylesterase